jgi:hypothetical protein
VTSKVREIRPPRSWAVHGVEGPIQDKVNVTVEPLNEGTWSRVTIRARSRVRGSVPAGATRRPPTDTPSCTA